VYADNVSTLGETINIVKKNTGTLLDVSKEVGLVVNTNCRTKSQFTENVAK
jgi:hypothetical protein